MIEHVFAWRCHKREQRIATGGGLGTLYWNVDTQYAKTAQEKLILEDRGYTCTLITGDVVVPDGGN